MQGQRCVCEYLIYFTCTVGDQWATFEVKFSDLNSSNDAVNLEIKRKLCGGF